MRYLPGPPQDYNPDLPARILILPRPRVGVMYTPKCASARIAYWWLKQADLLDYALRFSEWSHDFEGVYHQSREFIATTLSFAPKKNSIYKFVRHPLTRALSAFRHYLQYPEGYGILADRTGLSFHQYLDLLQTTNYLENAHCLPQITAHESADRIRPVILKIEDGLDVHLSMLEMKHGLPPHNIDSNNEVRDILRQHSGRPRRIVSAGPDREIQFGRTPNYRTLVTNDIRRKIYALYRADFDAYGYSPDDAI